MQVLFYINMEKNFREKNIDSLKCCFLNIFQKTENIKTEKVGTNDMSVLSNGLINFIIIAKSLIFIQNNDKRIFIWQKSIS